MEYFIDCVVNQKLDNCLLGMLMNEATIAMVLSILSVTVAWAAYRRDASKIAVTGGVGMRQVTPDNPNLVEIGVVFAVANHGRRKAKLKYLVLKAPGYSPTMTYFYYIRMAKIAEHVIDEAEDYVVYIPLTPFAKEAIQRASCVYVVTSDTKKHKMQRSHLKLLKTEIKDVPPAEIEDKEEWGISRVKKPSRFFTLLMGGHQRDDRLDFFFDPTERR